MHTLYKALLSFTWDEARGNPIYLGCWSALVWGLLEESNKNGLEEIIELTLVFTKTKFPSREH